MEQTVCTLLDVAKNAGFNQRVFIMRLFNVIHARKKDCVILLYRISRESCAAVKDLEEDWKTSTDWEFLFSEGAQVSEEALVSPDFTSWETCIFVFPFTTIHELTEHQYSLTQIVNLDAYISASGVLYSANSRSDDLQTFLTSIGNRQCPSVWTIGYADKAELLQVIDDMTREIRKSSNEIDPTSIRLADLERVLASHIMEPETKQVNEDKHMALITRLLTQDGSWVDGFGPTNSVSVFQISFDAHYKLTFVIATHFNDVDYIGPLNKAHAIPDFERLMRILSETYADFKANPRMFRDYIQNAALSHAHKAFIEGRMKNGFAMLTFFSNLLDNRSETTLLNVAIGKVIPMDIPKIEISFVGNQLRPADSNIRDTFDLIRKNLPGGPCTMSITLLLHCLILRGYNHITLENHGKVGGCVCYTTSAEANSFYAFKHSANPNLNWVISSHNISTLKRLTEDDCKLFEDDIDDMSFISPYLLYNIINSMKYIAKFKVLRHHIDGSESGELFTHYSQSAHDLFEMWKTRSSCASKKRRKI